jgi:hypothetical protein
MPEVAELAEGAEPAEGAERAVILRRRRLQVVRQVRLPRRVALPVEPEEPVRCRRAREAARSASGIAAFRCRRPERTTGRDVHNTNYMETGVLSALQLTSMFPNLVIENFYVKTRNSMNAGVDAPPHAYVIPVQRDMTKPAELVRILKLQGIEVGTANAAFKLGRRFVPAAGSYVIKAGQPYWRLGQEPSSSDRTIRIPAASAPTTTAAGRWATRFNCRT